MNRVAPAFVLALAWGALAWGTLPTSAAATPDGAVVALLDAIEAGGGAAADPALRCAALRDEAAPLDPLTLLGPLADAVDGGPWAAARTIAVGDRAVRTIAVSGDEALVALGATVVTSADPAALEALVVATIVASGQPADEGSIAAALDRLPPLLDGSSPIGGSVRVVREAGEWRVCGDPLAASAGRASICDRPDAAAIGALVGDGVVATGSPGGCAWTTAAPGTGPAPWVEARLLPGATLGPIAAAWERGQPVTVAGRDGWAADGATWVAVDPSRLLAVVAVDGDLARSGALAGAVAEVVVRALGDR